MGLTANELSASKRTGGSNPLASAIQLNTSARSSTDRASDYGSEGWEFESLRARPAQRYFPSLLERLCWFLRIGRLPHARLCDLTQLTLHYCSTVHVVLATGVPLRCRSFRRVRSESATSQVEDRR
jgi:hypothetical protein